MSIQKPRTEKQISAEIRKHNRTISNTSTSIIRCYIELDKLKKQQALEKAKAKVKPKPKAKPATKK